VIPITTADDNVTKKAHLKRNFLLEIGLSMEIGVIDIMIIRAENEAS
jgi:hypothetical protein